MTSLKDLEKSLKLIRDNSIYGLPMYKLDDKTYEYCRNDAIDTYRYFAEYMGIKALVEPVGESRRDNMANNWLEMAKEGHFYAIDDEGNVVDFGKAWVCEVETCIGCEPEVTLRVTPRKVMKNEGASAHSFERECIEYHALKRINEENQELNRRLKKENEELRQQLANYESDSIKYADNDPKAVYLPLSTRRSYGKTKMLKEMLNSMYGTKAFKYDIKKVIFSGPCTIVFWQDGAKTMVRAQENETVEDKEKGLAMAIAKRVYGDKGNYNNVFKRWIYGEDWKKKERIVKKAIKLAKKNGDDKQADILKNIMEANLAYAFDVAVKYIENSEDTELVKTVKKIKEKIDDAMSIGFKGKRKDMGIIDEAADPIEED
ncbi:MAG: hypothetical protein J6U54_20265 [Clostridiales bacterium]|nr:hypothetical protein [Clostridiales bacterium]